MLFSPCTGLCGLWNIWGDLQDWFHTNAFMVVDLA
jgi:hypothetical protein